MTGQHYNSGTDDSSSFKVERRELKVLLDLLKAGQSVLITGGRKLGKTVLLQQVKRHLEFQKNNAASVVVCLYQDLMSLTQPPTAASLFNALSHKVPYEVNALLERRAVKARCLPAPDTWKNDPSLEFTRYLNDVLNHLDRTVGRVKFIYLLDECEALLGSEERHTLLGNLRALVGPETDNRVKLVVTGFRDIKDYEDPVTGTSPFTNVLLPLPLTLLQEHEFDELVLPLLEPLPDENKRILREQVLNATGGHPCLVQTICSLLTTEFSLQNFDVACVKAIKLLQGMAFNSWVGRFNSDDHKIFRRALQGESLHDENALSIEFLQYCGVVTVSNSKLLTPCGLFNTWYKQQFTLDNEHHTSGHSYGLLTSLTDALSQDASSLKTRDDLLNRESSVLDPTGASCALIMKGGGVKGLALVGALLELEKYYEFTAYVGTSAGAIVAGLLAAECSPKQLEAILRSTDFRRFQDGRWYLWVKNLLLYFYLHPGLEFEKWLWEHVKGYNKLTWKMKAPMMKDLKRHLTIYATQAGEGTLVFDSRTSDGNKSAPLTFAIRCSMSIPVFFKSPMHNGKPVFDGGLLENFPAERWLRDNPGYDFIGVYLGQKVLDPSGSNGTIKPILNTLIDRNDATFIDSHRERVIVVDPNPVGTTDFDLSQSEAEFLVLQGRADALEHLHHFMPEHCRPSESEMLAGRERAEAAKARAIKARRRRKRARLVKRISTAVIVVGLLIFLIIRFGVNH
jgi:predicted acylesterase/phospholipase RssA